MKRSALAIALGLFMAATAQAEAAGVPYVGVSAAYVNYAYEDIDGVSGVKGYVGWLSGYSGFGVELAGYSGGKADIDGLPLSLSHSGYMAAIVGSTGEEKLSLFGKLGVHKSEATLEGPGGSLTESGNGLYFALGFEARLTEYLAVRGEIESINSPADFADEEEIQMYTLGLVARF